MSEFWEGSFGLFVCGTNTRWGQDCFASVGVGPEMKLSWGKIFVMKNIYVGLIGSLWEIFLGVFYWQSLIHFGYTLCLHNSHQIYITTLQLSSGTFLHPITVAEYCISAPSMPSPHLPTQSNSLTAIPSVTFFQQAPMRGVLACELHGTFCRTLRKFI